jgi:hypothetical protein
MKANIRSSSYYIAQASARCTRCDGWTSVTALALPPNHETLEENQWQRVAANAFLFTLSGLQQSVATRLAHVAPGFHFSATACWENHCEHCGATLSEAELHCEVGCFMPGDEQEARAVHLVRVAEPFTATAAGYSLEPEFFDHMQRR